MPPAIGYWDVISPKVRTTRNCPATTIGIVQMNAGPAVARPKAKSVYTPTTGERYVNPSEKLLQSRALGSVAACIRTRQAAPHPPGSVQPPFDLIQGLRGHWAMARRYNATNRAQ